MITFAQAQQTVLDLTTLPVKSDSETSRSILIPKIKMPAKTIKVLTITSQKVLDYRMVQYDMKYQIIKTSTSKNTLLKNAKLVLDPNTVKVVLTSDSATAFNEEAVLSVVEKSPKVIQTHRIRRIHKNDLKNAEKIIEEIKDSVKANRSECPNLKDRIAPMDLYLNYKLELGENKTVSIEEWAGKTFIFCGRLKDYKIGEAKGSIESKDTFTIERTIYKRQSDGQYAGLSNNGLFKVDLIMLDPMLYLVQSSSGGNWRICRSRRGHS
jgi:hypothetical protein